MNNEPLTTQQTARRGVKQLLAWLGVFAGLSAVTLLLAPGAVRWGVVVVIFWLMLGIKPPWSKGVFSLAIGKDGKWSTSKVQVFIWTGVVAFIATCVFAATNAIPEIPTWVWVALGLSGSTAVGAKGITVGYIEAKRLQPSTPSDPKPATGWQGLIADDSGVPELAKTQMMFWTILSAVYIVWQALLTLKATPVIPEMPTSFLILTGLGQGIYLGDKLLDSEQPRLTGLSCSSCTPGLAVTITGANFGTVPEEISIELADSTQVNPSSQPTETSVSFIPPESLAGERSWPLEGKTVSVRVVVRGVKSVNELRITIRPATKANHLLDQGEDVPHE